MNEKHGHSQKDRIYRIWVAMRQRCDKPYRTNYADYGGRGIRVCKEWDTSFIAFKAWADASGYAPTLSIDRLDPNGGYYPSNCKWSTPLEQGTKKRGNCLVEIDGVTKHVSEWARDGGFHLTTLYRRYYKGSRGHAFIEPGLVRGKSVTLEAIKNGTAAAELLAKSS